jgi:hypothetical protein
MSDQSLKFRRNDFGETGDALPLKLGGEELWRCHYKWD